MAKAMRNSNFNKFTRDAISSYGKEKEVFVWKPIKSRQCSVSLVAAAMFSNAMKVGKRKSED